MQLQVNNITKSYGKNRALSDFTATPLSCGQNKNSGSPQDIFVMRSWLRPSLLTKTYIK